MELTPREARESGREYALRMLKENIIQLELKPGSRVSENELAQELGLSRTPVREALMELAKAKIVEVYPQRGSSIALIDYDLVEEAQFMRVTLECAVAVRCCERGVAPEALARLRENLSLQAMYRRERSRRLLALDNDFHRQLFDMAKLSEAHGLLSGLIVHFDRVRALSLTAVREMKTVEDHLAIYEAIARRDAEAARALMHEHLSRYRVDREAIAAKYAQYIK